MSELLLVKELPNGMTLLAQPMEHVSSAAITFLVRCGSSYDPPDLTGAAAVAAEWVFRGAGDRDSRQLNDALDELGSQRQESVQSEHLQLSAALLGRNLFPLLDLYADILLSPRLEEDTFEPCRTLTAQDLQSLEDEPARKCNFLLREKFFPYPLGRIIYGTAESLASMRSGAVRDHVQSQLTSRGAILGVAGQFDWDELCARVQHCFGEWAGSEIHPPLVRGPAGGATHIHKDSAQMHITLGHRAVISSGESYYAARIAEAILSRGMGSRLFTEVREKRALAYHVSTSYLSLHDHAGMFTYAGTRPDLADQTFDVTISELKRLGKGVESDELDRAETQLRSALRMQGASTSIRASSLAGDWYFLRRLRTLAELSAAIQAVTEKDVLDYLQEYPAEDFTILTIGPEPLAGVSTDSPGTVTGQIDERNE